MLVKYGHLFRHFHRFTCLGKKRQPKNIQKFVWGGYPQIIIPPGKDRWRNAIPLHVLVYHGPLQILTKPPDLGVAIAIYFHYGINREYLSSH